MTASSIHTVSKPKPGRVYTHYKGGRYQVIANGRHTETAEELVVYQSLSTGDVWIRSLKEFNDRTPDGTAPRFKESL